MVTLPSDKKNKAEKRDTLFQKDIYPKNSFVFDTQVAKVFDNMLSRSIPYYQEVMELSSDFLLKNGPGGIFYDLGSSTGNFLLKLGSQDHSQKYEYRGIDNSSAMVNKANEKYQEVKSLFPKTEISFLCDDILNHDYENCGGVSLHYTLQFIAPDKRIELLRQLYTVLCPGGSLVLSEKVKEESPSMNDLFINRYHHFKASNDYTAAEIARKKEALEEVLIPFTTNHYETILREIGFREFAVAFKWYNFITWFIVK